MRKIIVAVDFDGCITSGVYKTNLVLQDGAKQALIKMKEMDIDLILWTCREDIDGSLNIAKEFLKDNDMLHLFSKINDNSDFSEWGNNRKVLADVYLDDKMVGGWCGWEKALNWVISESEKINAKSVTVDINIEKIVNGMCLTWDHSYGLRLSDKERKQNPLMSGYTDDESKNLYNMMKSIFVHNIKPILDLAGVKYS